LSICRVRGAPDLRTEGNSGGFPVLQKVYLPLGALPRKILDKVAEKIIMININGREFLES
jgi:hypothetical protein